LLKLLLLLLLQAGLVLLQADCGSNEPAAVGTC
jgi:hypothetical protein